MGCDIHAYVEYSLWNDSNGHPYWRGFAHNFGDRNYTWFGVIAGVRNPAHQLFEPKGAPDYRTMSWKTREDFGEIDEGAEGCADWHSHSWLTSMELDTALTHYSAKTGDEGPVEFKAALAAMRAFEASGAKTRLIFWFDN